MANVSQPFRRRSELAGGVATPVSIRGNGYAGAPAIQADRQIGGWRRVG